MVYGTHMEVCWKCRQEFMSGNCVEGVCDKCKNPITMKNPCKEIDLTHLVSPIMREKLKQEIQGILNDALSGTVDIYRYKQDGCTYIRWGIVAKHINEAIDSYWPKENVNEG